MAAEPADQTTDLHLYQFGDPMKKRDAPSWAEQCPMEATMREEQVRDEAITELGEATVLTQGERLEQSIEALTFPDKYDVG